MFAAFYENQGSAADVLKTGKVAMPVVGAGDVMVRIVFSGLNPSDIKVRTGFLGPMQYERIIPHQDGSGVIVELGDGVDPGRLGQRVWVYQAQYGHAYGTAAEFVVVPAEQAVPLPENTSFEIGASLGVAALTAHRCLFADGDIRGLRVLVHGGAGVVGEAAIQLAKWAGAWVVTTVRDPADVENVRSKGADLVILMTEQNVVDEIRRATDGGGVDRIVEVDLLANLEKNLNSINSGGTISTYAVTGGHELTPLPVLSAIRGNYVFRFVYVYTIPELAKKQAIEAINACLIAGSYHPTIGLKVPLDHISRAHQALESRTVKGKVLIQVA